MEELLKLLQQDTAWTEGMECFRAGAGQNLIYGLSGAQKSLLVAAGSRRRQQPILVLLPSGETLDEWQVNLQAFLPECPIFSLPVMDTINFAVTAKSRELSARKMNILDYLLRGEDVIVLAEMEAAGQMVMDPSRFRQERLFLKNGGYLEREVFLQNLVHMGYERVGQVDTPGQVSARGGILDVFPVNCDTPVRLELFDDEIDSLRIFDPMTQRSLEGIDRVVILPVHSLEQGKANSLIFDYLPAEGMVILDEPSRLREQLLQLQKENPELKKTLATWNSIAKQVTERTCLSLSLLVHNTTGLTPRQTVSMNTRAIVPFHKQLDSLVEEIKSWLKRSYTVILLLPSAEKIWELQSFLLEQQVGSSWLTDQALQSGAVYFQEAYITEGFELPQARLVFIGEKDIFGRQKRRLHTRVCKEQKIHYFRELNPGDYVVHINHGIGKYMGIETLDTGGKQKDYLFIRYAGEDKLFVPTDQLDLLQKYIGPEGETPRLHKMGGSEWGKAKSRAKAAVADLAAELIELYATRRQVPGIAFEPDTPWQKEFEEAFPFEETPDQLNAIAQIKADMEIQKPMDRLLCGDVGFGKTEVALRAAFKAVMSGKQVAVFVPTTVLAQQHFQTFSSRMAGFGPTVEVISRFRSPQEQKATLNRVEDGRCDILIGTHRMLNQDVRFKNLGLLIVDEEQRFGVAQKEKLKRWRAHIDVLTLSATPIPRTLHMSLVGARDMSIIETPPEGRYPIQTYVLEYREDVIKEALERELKRGGQVYVVHNRISSISRIANQLQSMLPAARIGIAHGRMADDSLEDIMLNFYEGTYDVLVCTSLIENGLDVPNANTMIVYDADRFGLSQLYQMRGRVGRSRRLAFAYLTYRRDKVLTEIAEKRLHAIQEFTELGAGFKIAMRDLEIRGAGNLLGAQQHGHIVSVGFEMYCRLLEEAIAERQSGETVLSVPDPVLEFRADAYISGDYISDAMQKVEIYQRMVAIRTKAQGEELLEDLIDRFGDPPAAVINLLRVAKIKSYARRLQVRFLLEKDSFVEIEFHNQAPVNPTRIVELQQEYPGRVALLPGEFPRLRLKTQQLKQPVLPWMEKIMERLAPEKAVPEQVLTENA